MALVERLPEGPVAVIGDVHGEIDALDALLAVLDRDHPEARLVFLGDLADRGPDSPAVIRRVRERMERGALCVLGNHELSVLRGEDKGYNRWFFPGKGSWCPDELAGRPVPMATLAPSERAAVREWFGSLPLALERADLRVVHACWDRDAIAAARASSGLALALFQASGPEPNPLKEPPEITAHGPMLWRRDPAWEIEEERFQNANAVAVLTSGRERRAETDDEIVWSGGKWRPLVRDRWWERYDEGIPVVIGHYSRMWDPNVPHAKTALLFPGRDPAAPVGRGRDVYCVDYAVGERFHERMSPGGLGRGRLAALVWGEEEPVLRFDDGERVVVPAPGAGR